MLKGLKNARLFLQEGVLTVETLDNFDLWKEDIVRAVKSVLLNGPEHWAMVNRLIYHQLDDGTTRQFPAFSPTTMMNLGSSTQVNFSGG